MILEFRNATIQDLDVVSEIELKCFPLEEAATREAFEYRIQTFPTSFILAMLEDKVVGHVNGCCTDLPLICDELFEKDGGHNPNGKNQMIFGLAVLPEYQRKGIAEKLMKSIILSAKSEGRESVVLTCKNQLVHYYEKFGFKSLGISESTHGGAVWYDMICKL